MAFIQEADARRHQERVERARLRLDGPTAQQKLHESVVNVYHLGVQSDCTPVREEEE